MTFYDPAMKMAGASSVTPVHPSLHVMFSKFLQEATLPSDWLKANVSPIYSANS